MYYFNEFLNYLQRLFFSFSYIPSLNLGWDRNWHNISRACFERPVRKNLERGPHDARGVLKRWDG